MRRHKFGFYPVGRSADGTDVGAARFWRASHGRRSRVAPPCLDENIFNFERTQRARLSKSRTRIHAILNNRTASLQIFYSSPITLERYRLHAMFALFGDFQHRPIRVFPHAERCRKSSRVGLSGTSGALVVVASTRSKLFTSRFDVIMENKKNHHNVLCRASAADVLTVAAPYIATNGVGQAKRKGLERCTDGAYGTCYRSHHTN